MAGRFENLR